MCLTCGCGKPLDDHGDARHIVLDELVAAAKAAGVAIEQAADNITGTLDGMKQAAKAREADLHKVDEGAVGDVRARHLIRWYNEGADGQIPWGSRGDFDACLAVAGRHMPQGKAKGFCANRHHDALGIWPATHAAQEREGKAADAGPPPFDHDIHPRHHASGLFVERADVDQAMRRIHDGRQSRRDTVPRPATPEHPTTE